MTLKNRVTNGSKERDTDKDFFQTPAYATELLIEYLIEKDINYIWEPACGLGMIADCLRESGLQVFESDIKQRKENITQFDFLSKISYPPMRRFTFDAIITNPPYNIKDKFIERCFELKVPFALFLPLYAIGGVKRVEMYMENGVELLIPNRRTNFIYPNAGDDNWFHAFWLCHDILPEKLIFAEMERK